MILKEIQEQKAQQLYAKPFARCAPITQRKLERLSMQLYIEQLEAENKRLHQRLMLPAKPKDGVLIKQLRRAKKYLRF